MGNKFKIQTFALIALLAILQACNFGGSGEGAVFSPVAGHKPVDAKFTASVNDGIYIASDNINIQLSFPFNVTVTGTPFINIDIGGSPQTANYVSGDGSKTLTFQYSVVLGDLDTDGISVAGPIDLNGGTLKYTLNDETKNCELAFDSPDSSNVLVDAVTAGINTFTPPADGLYAFNQELTFAVEFTEVVYVTGTPQVVFDLGGSTFYANYFSGSSTNTLIFKYSVGNSDIDLDGITISSPINLNGGTIEDFASNPANIGFLPPATGGVLVNGDVPVVTSVAKPANGTYLLGEELDFRLTFSEAVDVDTAGGTPRLVLDIGGTTYYANYQSGTGTTNLLFRKIVLPNEVDNDGIDLVNAIDLNGGTIRDATLVDAAINFDFVPTAGIIVDGSVPDVVDVQILDGNYTTGQSLNFTVVFDQPVNVTGNPELTFIAGITPLNAVYLSGSGNTNLTFQYIVQMGDNDLDGIAIQSPLTLNGGFITNNNGVNANLVFTPPSTPNVIVDTVQAGIIAFTPPANNTYSQGADLDFVVQWSEPVNVSGTPRIEITLDSGTVYADYLSGTGTDTLTFRYTVGSDEDLNGIDLTTPIALNGGNITDAATIPADLAFTDPDTSGILIDGILPYITSFTISDDWYSEAENLDIIVNYNENVDVVGGTPQLEITLATGGTVYADYVSGTGSNALLFRYTIVDGEEDKDGIDLVSPMLLGGATIKDAILNDADLTFTPPTTTGVLVDTIEPTISSVSPPADGSYNDSSSLDFIVTYDEAVNVTGSRIQLDVGGATVYADYVSGTGTANITYSYPIVDGDNDADGIGSISPLDLNGGSVADLAGNGIVDLTFTPPVTTAVLVDTVEPTITSITPPANANYIIGQQLDFIVNTDENITVSGTPQLAIALDSGTVYADFTSGDGTQALTFSYTVQSSDVDADGIVLVSPLGLNDGTLKDIATNDLALTFTPPVTSGITVDGNIPEISSVTIASNTYLDTQNLDFVVTFTEAVTITGSPYIEIDIGGNTRQATCPAGGPNTVHTCTYTVTTGEEDLDGIGMTSPLQLNGGTINDASTNPAILTYTLPGNLTSILVDALAPTITSVTVPGANTYKIGDDLNFTINWSEQVVLTGAAAAIDITVGASGEQAICVPGTASFHICTYTVQAGDVDADGIVHVSPVNIGTSTITDVATNTAVLTFTPADTSTVLVDGVAPTITSITPPADATYSTGQNLDFIVNFSEQVTISGTDSYLSIDIGGSTEQAICAAGTGTTATCTYTVVLGDADADGITMSSPAVLATSTWQDNAGNDVDPLTFTPPTMTNVLVDAGQPTIVSVTVPSNTYLETNNIDFTVTFDEAVTISGSPYIEIDVGGSTKQATCAAGGPNTVHTCTYTVEAGLEDLDGIGVTSPLNLNGGTIQDGSLNNAILTFTLPGNLATVFVDSLAPTITSVTVPGAGWKKLGDTVDFTINWSESVTLTGADAAIDLTIGVTSVQAICTPGSGTTTACSYTVGATDEDTDGIVHVSPVNIGTSTFQDAAGNNADLTFTPANTSGVNVDGIVPTISSVDAPADATYLNGQSLDFTVNFSESVTITGTDSYVDLDIGGDARQAICAAGTGTSATCSYTITLGEIDLDGIGVSSPMVLGTSNFQDVAGNDVTPLTYTPPTTTGVFVDADQPTITSVVIVSDTYIETENMDFDVTFSEAVTITGSPYIEIDIGGTTKNATCPAGGPAATHTCTYTVEAGLDDSDGIGMTSPININGGSIKDGALNDAILTYTLPGNLATVLVDTTIPTITSVTVPGAGWNKLSDSVDFTINWSESVTLTGADAAIDITIGVTPVQAICTPGTGATTACSYTVGATDEDTDGIVHVSPVNAGTSTFKDAAGNSAVLTFTPADTSGVNVDGIVPTISSVTAPADTTYINGQNLDFTVTFSESVTITGTDSYVDLDIGGNARQAICAAGTGTTATCSYTIVIGEVDLDGIGVSSPMVLGTSTFQDVAGNDVTPLTYTPPVTTGVLVDAEVPTISSITIASNTYVETDNMDFVVTFSEPVTITGSPYIDIDIGGTPKQASCPAGGPNAVHTCTYTVEAGVDDSDGIGMTSPLTINGGTIQDAGTNNADLTYTLPGNLASVLVDTSIPTITSVTVPGPGWNKLSDTVDFTINWSESVTLTGADAAIDITIGVTPVQAICTPGTGTTTACSYTVGATDEDTDGIVHVSPVNAGTSTFEDAAGNNADLTFTPADTSGVNVDGIVPTISSVTPPTDQTYIDAEDLIFTVNFSESVTVTGTDSAISLDIGGNGRPATCAAGTGTSSACTYTITTGEVDLDGIGNSSPAVLNTSTWQDQAGNNVVLTFTPPNTTAVLVDADVPTVSITSPSDSSYINIAGDSATFPVNGSCSEFGQTVVIKVDGVAATSPTGMVCDGASFIGTIDTTGLAEGTSAFTAEISDGANTGYSLTNNVDKDTIAPTLGIDAAADVSSANVTSYSLTGTCDEDTATVNINFGTVADTATCSSGTWSKTAWDVSEQLDNASVSITADMNDAAGNPATQATDSAAKDTVAPTVAITTPADSSTINDAEDSATFAVSGTCNESGQTVVIKFNGTAAPSQVGMSCDGANFSGTVDTTGLSYATHAWTAELTDAVGNTGVSATNSVERIQYTVAVTSTTIINIANETAYVVSGTCNTNTETVTVTVGGLVVDTPTCTGGTFTTANMIVSSVGDGPAILLQADHGTATDTATTVLKDTVAPTVTLGAQANIVAANASSFPVVGTCSDDGGTIDVSVGGQSNSGTCSSGSFSVNVNATAVGDGTGITVLADHTDAAGNPATQDSTTTDKDATIPTVTITYSPDITAANEASYSISGACSENGRTVTVNIDGLGFTPTCSSGAWSVGPTNVSSRSDNANLPITADTDDAFGNDATQAAVTVNKDSANPTVSITSSPDISNANVTEYVVSGTCSENGQSVSVDIGGISKTPNCSSGTWSTGFVDTTGLSDGSVSITADHSTAPQDSTSVNKDTASETVTITSAPDINVNNELIYIVSGTCSDNGQQVSVYVDTLNFKPTCTSGSYSTGQQDVSSIADGSGISVTADHSTATQASTTINKDTTTPTVSSLSVPTTLITSADLSWNLNDPGGFTIDDYIINYRVKGSPTWLVFNDGVSTNTTATVTGLVESTTYEFRVNVQYDTSNNSPWSNTAEGETKPDDPIFGPNAAMNVGGATTSTVAAYEDGTNVTLNGGALVTLNRGQTHVFTSSQYDVIDANKPIFTAGRLGNTNVQKSANVVWQPTGWAGTYFSFNATRTNPQRLDVYAIEDTFVEVKQGSTVLASATITAGNGNFLTWSVYGSYQVVATGAILAFHHSTGSGNKHDPKPILPGYTEIIGYPSNSMRITTVSDGTNYNLIHSNSTTASGSLNKADVVQVNPSGGESNLYAGQSLLISADKNISGASFADSNGLCAAPFMNTNLMKTKYIIPTNGDYIAFASKTAGTIDVVNSAGTTVTTLTLTRSGANPNAPYKARQTNPTAGYRYIATVPVAAWYQPNNFTGASDQDETIMYGTND